MYCNNSVLPNKKYRLQFNSLNPTFVESYNDFIWSFKSVVPCARVKTSNFNENVPTVGNIFFSEKRDDKNMFFVKI